MTKVFASVSSPLIFTILHYSLITMKAFAANAVIPTRLVTRLIHSDPIRTPYISNANAMADDQIGRLMKRSAARFGYLIGMTERDIGTSNFQVELHPLDGASFLVNFSIGDPPVPQFAVMDTGSSLLWVQCIGCEDCPEQTDPMLDPSKSKTYNSLSCSDIFCGHAPNGYCSSSDECKYYQRYIEGTSSKGTLATEQIIFKTSDDNKVVITDAVFGCGHENEFRNHKHYTGILGLGYTSTSLAVRLGGKFSYCIGNIRDREYSFNQLALGDGVEIEGYETPLEMFGGHYHITLEGISVEEKRLDIDGRVFERRGTASGVIIDSGTTLTFLAEDAYMILREEVKRLLDGMLTRYWIKNYVCYRGLVSRDLVGFPGVTFHFARGADLVLDTSSMFFQFLLYPYPDVFCMAVRPSTQFGSRYKNFSVIGLNAQQYYNVAYDLGASKLSFQRIDCELVYNDYS